MLGLGAPFTGVVWTRDFPKDNYEIRWEARRVQGGDFFASLTFPVGNSFCTFVNGGWGGDIVGLSSIDGWDASDKSARRRFVADSYRILLLLGDNFEDFAPGTQGSVADRAALADKYVTYWGTKWIVLPNPTYGSWEQAITSGQGKLTEEQTLAAKYRALRF